MKRFFDNFKRQKCNVIGMIHVGALPGTPKYAGNFEQIIQKACAEAEIYKNKNLDGVLIENMHDVPYVQNSNIGSEIVACMTRIANEVKQIVSQTIPIGIQILACGNTQAISVAKACNLQFVRTEGFVFSHVADEGFTNACAGELLRFRRNIDANDVLILTDIKKKHCSHSITEDVSLLETVKAAEFFLTDGVILTGTATGHAVDLSELNSISDAGSVNTPILLGSGTTIENIESYFDKVQGVVIGSHFKKAGYWENDVSEKTIENFMNKIKKLREN